MRRDMATFARYPPSICHWSDRRLHVFSQTREKARFAKAALCILIRRNQLVLHGPRLNSFSCGDGIGWLQSQKLGFATRSGLGREFHVPNNPVADTVRFSAEVETQFDRIRANFRAGGHVSIEINNIKNLN
jgi:hypothetical protein